MHVDDICSAISHWHCLYCHSVVLVNTLHICDCGVLLTHTEYMLIVSVSLRRQKLGRKLLWLRLTDGLYVDAMQVEGSCTTSGHA